MSLAGFVRRADPDRYFCALFAPAAHRETLFTLYAFNHELARAGEVAREPGLALIRLQWWREVVEGACRAHEVAGPLHAALQSSALGAGELLAMIGAREREAEGEFAGLEEWLAWLHEGPGSLMVAAGRALGAPEEVWPRLRRLGAGEGVLGQMRNAARNTAAGRSLLPVGVPQAALAEAGLSLLGWPEPCAPAWIAAALPAARARQQLRRFDRTQISGGFSAKLAILLARLGSRC